VLRNNIVIYIQQDARLHSLFYLETVLHVSVGKVKIDKYLSSEFKVNKGLRQEDAITTLLFNVVLRIAIRKYKFNVHGSARRYNIVIYIQQDATLHSLFYLETALHVSVGTITHHQERKQL